MTFIVRTRIGDIDVNPKGTPMGRRELLKRAQRLVQRALQEGEAALVFERANGREAQVDAVSGQYVRTGSPANVVAAGLQRRGGAGAGRHHTRTRDVAKGSSRKARHGGRAGVRERENPDDDFTFEHLNRPHPEEERSSRRTSTPGTRTTRPSKEVWKQMSKEEKAEVEQQIATELLAQLQGVSLESLTSVLEKGAVPSYPGSDTPVNPFGLQIFSDVPDVVAAANALKIPVSEVVYYEPEKGPPWQGEIHVDNEMSTEGAVFGLSYPPRAPRVEIADRAAKGFSPFSWTALTALSKWLRDNDIHSVLIKARPPYGRFGDPVAYPAAGDAVFLLSTLPEVQPGRVSESFLRSPVSGKVVNITPSYVEIEEGKNYASEYSRLANVVADARAALTSLQAHAGKHERKVVARRRELAGEREALVRSPSTDRNRASIARLDREIAELNASLGSARKQDWREDLEYENAHAAFYGNARPETWMFTSFEGTSTTLRRPTELPRAIPPLIPALGYESAKGYPSLSQEASLDEVRRASQALFAPDLQSESIVVRPEGRELWRVQVVARQPVHEAEVAQALARAAVLEREHANVTEHLLMLESREPGALPLITAARERILEERTAAATLQREQARSKREFRPLAQALGKALNIDEPQADQGPVQVEAPADINNMARLRAMSDVKDKLDRIDGELRKVRALLRDKSVSRMVFRGAIVRRVRVPTGGRSASLADGVEIGATITAGQQLTKVPERAALVPSGRSTSAAPAQASAPRIRPINVYLRRDTDVDAIAGMFAPKGTALPVRSVLIRDGVRLAPNEVGSFVLNFDGTPYTVYATTKTETPLKVEPTIRMLGGLGNFLEKLGILAAADVARMTPAARESFTLPAAQVQSVASTAFGDDPRMTRWLKGETAAHALFLSTEPPAGAVRGYGAGSGAPETKFLAPLNRTDRDAVPVDEIIGLTLYAFVHTRPLDIAPMKVVKGRELMEGGVSFADALAEASALQDKIQSRVRQMEAEVEAVPRNQRVEVFVQPADVVVAGKRAQAYGNEQDIRSAINRLVRKRLTAMVAEGGQEILAKINAADPENKMSPFRKLAEAARRTDPSMAEVTTEDFLRSIRPRVEDVSAMLDMYRALSEGKLSKADLASQALQIKMNDPNKGVANAVSAMEGFDEVLRIRKTMLEPRVIEDPMGEVLLVATRKPDNSGRSRPKFEVVIRDGVPYKGYGGKPMTHKINAFKRIEAIGYVPSEMPATKELKFARKDLAAATSMSSSVALAAARGGLRTEHIGGYGARSLTPSATRGGVIYGEGSAIVGAKGAGVPAAEAGGDRGSFGTLAGVSPESRMESILYRYRSMFPDEAEAAEAQMGARGTSSERIAEKRYSIAEAARQAGVEMPLTVEEAAERRRQATIGKRETVASVFSAPAEKEVTEDDFTGLNNPRGRMRRSRVVRRRNPWGDDLFAILNASTNVEQKLASGIATALEVLASAPTVALPPEAARSVDAAGFYLGAMTWGFRSLGEEGMADAAAVSAMLDQVLAPDFLKAMGSGAPAAVTVMGQTYTPTDSDRRSFFRQWKAGPFYSVRPDGGVEERRLATAAALFVRGLRWGAWLAVRSAFETSEAERTAISQSSVAFQQQMADAAENIQKLRTLDPKRLGNAARVLAREDDKIVVKQSGFVLTRSSLDVLGGRADVGEAVASVQALRNQAEGAYADFMADVMGASQGETVDRSALTAKMERYERAGTALREQLRNLELRGLPLDKDPAVVSMIESGVVHYLAGRTRPGERPAPRDTRLLRLRESVSRLLDMYGRPVIPVDQRTLQALGLRALNYGEGYTLESRPSLLEAREIIVRTTAKGEKAPPATATLMCRPGTRAVREFPAPFKQYRPAEWDGKGFLNVIWLSPDGQLARLYRAGASVCILRRHPNEGLQPFLDEVAENWNLWLTDPEHQRQARDQALNVWMGQSGDISGAMFKLNTKGDRGALSRNVMAARMRRAGVGVAADGNSIVPVQRTANFFKEKIDAGYLTKWGDSDAVEADARLFSDAMEQAGLVTPKEADEALNRLLGDRAGAAQAAGADASRDAATSLVVLAPALAEYAGGEIRGIGGDGRLPEGADRVVNFILGQPASGTVRVYDQAYISDGNVRLRSLEAALLTGSDEVNNRALRLVNLSLAGSLIVARAKEDSESGPKLEIVAGNPAGRSGAEVNALQNELTKSSEGDITFNARAAVLPQTRVDDLTQIALSAGAPVLVVDTHDVPDLVPNDKSALLLFANAVAKMVRSGTVSPIVYVTPEESERARISVNVVRMDAAQKLGIQPEEVPVMYATYATLNRVKSLLTRVAANPLRRRMNPRQREVRQVAASWMRAYPFPG
jgi:hypothetical protein